MKMYRVKDYNAMSRKAANIIAAQIILKPDSVLGLATGGSPVGTYEYLVQWYKDGDLDFSQVKTVNLDEYKGLSKDNDQSYFYFMDQHLFSKVNIDIKNTHIPDGTIEDSDEACKRYNSIIEGFGGADLQLLGIGHNGHIGFNEPDEMFIKETHCAALTDSTIEANARLFENPDDVPRYAYTMGIQNIMQAKTIVLIASGKDKAKAIKDAFTGPVTPAVPASILQLHPNVIVIGDEDVFSLYE